MLDKHLIAKISPKANGENLVFWDNYRVTVLQGGLFRVEYSENKKYRDAATQTVWFRDMPKQDFTVTETGAGVKIATEKCTLVLRKGVEDCYVLLDGEKVALDNAGNLKGTYRTLDCCDGDYYRAMTAAQTSRRIELGDGVCSRTGVAVFDDAGSLSLGENGEVSPEKGDGKDLYVFAYGNDYRGAVRALYTICGETPLIPRFALGNWWGRYHKYTDREYLQLLERFEDHDVPLTVATVDMDWHYSLGMEDELPINSSGKNTPYYIGPGLIYWTGYTWNKTIFPDYKAFLKKLHEKGVKTALNLHPADGVRWWEDMYADMAKALGRDPSTEAHIPFDITDANYINAYFSVLHKPYEKDGVDFWWMDWQQGTQSGMEGLDPLWSLNHYHYLDNAVNHSTPLLLSRYAGIGSHRYPLGFSGDSHITWNTLQYLPYFTTTASNIGYTWWSHDIGGHMLGTIDNELYVRHLQFGVFSPINRLHSSDARVTTKEPWCYGNGAGKIAAEWLRFRHKLLPFLYTCSYRTHKDGLALMEPLYYEWDEAGAYGMAEEYLFGGSLIVAPVTTPSENGYARTKVWIPAGRWTDIFTGDVYEAEGSEERTLLRDLESVPVLAKAGTVLPLSGDKGNSCKNPENLDVWAYNGDGEFTLYEDGNEENKAGEFYTHFRSSYKEGGTTCLQSVTISSEGKANVIPKNRKLTLYFKNVEEGSLRVGVDGKEVAFEEKLADHLAVVLPFKAGKEYVVTAAFKKKTEPQKRIDRAASVLLRAEGENAVKCAAFDAIEKTTTVEEYERAVAESGVREEIKLRLLETL